ncbi:GNAT family N-acetyltransferase [Pseudoclavibacter helvolus]|uniref:GNAT family N-acetyltransferase n=1 Tax=Pseudoclavibacter helvolus TaxID=255205 RepID=UPI0024AD0E4C|nr:GNAT family N-acetyltransferase [Pseudoclavibacter helvolus]
MSELYIEELSADNIVAANTLTLKPGQEAFVAPVSNSISEAYVNQTTSWPRVVVLDGRVVGFVMANFDEDAPDELFRATILRMNVDADFQRRGIGSFAVNAILDEAARRGFDKVTTIWEEGDLGPGDFFRGLGFIVTGETQYGETVGERELSQHGTGSL